MGNYRYITNRVLLNKAGQEKGNIAVMVPNGTEMARIRYRCPECSHTFQGEIEWKRPFSVRCSGCGLVMKLPRLKDEIKKEKKLERT